MTYDFHTKDGNLVFMEISKKLEKNKECLLFYNEILVDNETITGGKNLVNGLTLPTGFV